MSLSPALNADTIMMIQSFWIVSRQDVNILITLVADAWNAMKIMPPPFIVNRRKNMTPPSKNQTRCSQWKKTTSEMTDSKPLNVDIVKK